MNPLIPVIYWPSTVPSIKRCTCVNKWKNSGSRWTLENNITRCPGGLSQSETGCQRENQLADWGLCGPQWPTVEQPKLRWERNAAMVKRRTWVNIAVRSCLHSFLTHNKHHLFENKVWEIYIKKCIRSFVEVVITVVNVPVYIYIRKI